jgi:hypothetical protein
LGEPGIKVIAFENEKSRACWLTAMRLAKVSDTIFLPAFPARSRRTAAFYTRNTRRGAAIRVFAVQRIRLLNYTINYTKLIFARVDASSSLFV